MGMKGETQTKDLAIISMDPPPPLSPHLLLRHHPLSRAVVPLLEERVPVDPPLRVDQDMLGAGHGEGHTERVGLGEILQKLRHALEGLEIVDKI